MSKAFQIEHQHGVNMKAALEYERVGEMSGDLPKVT